MNSVSEVFGTHPNLKHLVAFRCKLRDDDDEMYRRNRKWLSEGKTGYWGVSEDREPDGIVILIDAEDGDGVEVWLGLGVERLEEHEGGRWVLGTRGRRPFQLLGLAEVGLNEFLGKQVLIGATYIDADEALDGPAPRKRRPPVDVPDRVVPFEVGHLYNRRNDIHGPYKGQERGGIATPSEQPFVFLFTGSSGGQYGYSDGWQDDGTFAYTGEGQVGDMQFIRGNAAIRDHAKNGKDLFLFEETKGGDGQRFLGRFGCAGWEERIGPDKEGSQRKIIVFTLVPEERSESRAEEEAVQALSQRTLKQLRELALAASGTSSGTPKVSQRKHYERSAAVKAYVLSRANGVCEACEQPAPFKRLDGTPYLEPHHIRRVSDGGPDDIRFVAGICPSCHRRVHHGADGEDWNSKLARKVSTKEDI